MIHAYKNNGYNIIMDVNSGSVHVVEDLSYDAVAYLVLRTEETKELHKDQVDEATILKMQPLLAGREPAEAVDRIPDEEVVEALSKEPFAYKPEEIREALEEIRELTDQEMLFTGDLYENLVIDFKNHKTVVKALCLHVTHDCNLGCKYCFAEEGEYHGSRGLMSAEVGKRALDFLIENSGSRRNLEVDFFGGEPTMNWKVVKELVEYGRKREKEANKNFRFTLTTNGILLNEEIMDFSDREMANVVMSLDGRKEVNDRMRPFRNSTKGSYDTLVPKFQKWADRRNQDRYYIRGTFTRNNLDFAQDAIHFADLGFEQMSIEPVVAPSTADYAIREEDIRGILEQYDILAKEYIKRKQEGRGFNFFHFMIDLDQGPCIYKRLSGCGAGTEYLAVTPWGDLYPCHQFVGLEQFKLGDIWTGVQNTEVVDQFKHCNVYAKEQCRTCFARYYCSGGCAANSFNFSGSLTGAYEIGCAMQKKRIECAIMIKAAMADYAEEHGEEYAANLESGFAMNRESGLASSKDGESCGDCDTADAEHCESCNS